MNIGFIMDRWEEIDAKGDTTLRIIHEAVLRGHNVGVLYPDDLMVKNGEPHGFFKILRNGEKKDAVALHRSAVFEKKIMPVSDFDAIFLRKDPPLNYLMLNFLDAVKDDVFMINSIEGLRKANNKLYLATSEEFSHLIPETHISNDVEYLLSIVRENEDKKLILKPVAGCGGCGVILLEKGIKRSARSLLEYYTENGKNYVILQEYVEGADEGDVRVLILDGEPIGAMRRVPAEGEIRSNIHAGGRAVEHALTEREKEICRQIAPKLLSDGLYLVGIDLICGKLIEINVVSPGGIADIEQLTGVKLQEKVIDFVERMVNEGRRDN